MIQSLIITFIVFLTIVVTFNTSKDIIYPDNTIIRDIYKEEIYTVYSKEPLGRHIYGRAGP